MPRAEIMGLRSASEIEIVYLGKIRPNYSTGTRLKEAIDMPELLIR